MDRQTARAGAIDARLMDLEKQADDPDQRLRRLYKHIGDGFAQMDEPLRERINALQKERYLANVALDRAGNLSVPGPPLRRPRSQLLPP